MAAIDSLFEFPRSFACPFTRNAMRAVFDLDKDSMTFEINLSIRSKFRPNLIVGVVTRTGRKIYYCYVFHAL